jgi:hypothetical protein
MLRFAGNCPHLTGLTESLKRGKIWFADKFAFRSAKGHMKLLKRERVAVEAVWK